MAQFFTFFYPLLPVHFVSFQSNLGEYAILSTKAK